MSDSTKKMQPHELGVLRGLAADIGRQDVKLGLRLDHLLLHLARAHGLDPAEEDAKAEEEQRTDARVKAAPSEKGKP